MLQGRSEIMPFGFLSNTRSEVFPNSRNTIPGRVKFTADLRHPDPGKLAAMDTKKDEIVSELKQASQEISIALSRHRSALAAQ